MPSPVDFPRVDPAIIDLESSIAGFLGGSPMVFDSSILEMLDLSALPPFQMRVLMAEHAIPGGKVSTYGRIAAHLGVPGGARPVGNALARNPFPIVIPCHRAVRSDGSLGGYQGGPAMKRMLLENEGIRLDRHGRVILDGDQVHY